MADRAPVSKCGGERSFEGILIKSRAYRVSVSLCLQGKVFNAIVEIFWMRSFGDEFEVADASTD